MSLVSCIMADMQYTMMTSDCEDKAANITAKLKSVTEQGSDLGKLISGLENELDQAKYAFRELDSAKWSLSSSQDPRAQQFMGVAEQRQAYCQQRYAELGQRKQQMECEKRRLMAQEKELTAQQKANEVMQKFSTAAAEKFGKMIDPAIKRFFGQG